MIRQKSIGLGQMERCKCGRKEVNPHLIVLLLLLSSMEEGITSWYAVVWAGIV